MLVSCSHHSICTICCKVVDKLVLCCVLRTMNGTDILPL